MVPEYFAGKEESRRLLVKILAAMRIYKRIRDEDDVDAIR